MAKTPSTINLEDKFWTLIEDYKKENDFSSRNDAIQLILNEWDMFKKFHSNSILVNPNNIVLNAEVSNNINQNNTDKNLDENNYTEDKQENEPEEVVDSRISEGLMKVAFSMKPE